MPSWHSAVAPSGAVEPCCGRSTHVWLTFSYSLAAQAVCSSGAAETAGASKAEAAMPAAANHGTTRTLAIGRPCRRTARNDLVNIMKFLTAEDLSAERRNDHPPGRITV